MDATKQRLLDETYQTFMDIGLSIDSSLDKLDQLVYKDIMGYGTTLDEKIFSFSEFRNLLMRQREQSHGMQMEWVLEPVLRRVLEGGNSAVYADDILLKIKIANEVIEMQLRFSIVLEFEKNSWRVVHWHGSKPEAVKSEEDTWGVEDWKKKNAELEKKVAEKTAELQKSLDGLKATQAQLIHSEKMASLGELTAGIAHEIQNPLNFVNNFSEVNLELIDEMKTELKQGNTSDALEITDMLGQNLQKIVHHGKRADGIVKSMMHHSSNSSGQKESVDLNALVDEYLRLAYHGLRAKDKSFNAILETHFDTAVDKVNVAGQDIGRVMINLFNNAFYAVNERKKQLSHSGRENYEPTVYVSTERGCDQILIKVKDNGNGIPERVLDKIYQPFFTTKPTGEGTGLGLSLSYDIITKGHGGEMKVQTKEGEGATFIIRIPTNE